MTDTTSYLMHLSTLIEIMPDALVVTNQHGRIVLINPQTETLFGYHDTELIGQTVECLMPERFRNHHITHRVNYSKNPQLRSMGRGLTLFGLKKGGAEFPVDVSLSPLDTTDGLIIIAAIRDISERKQLEDNLKHLAEHDSLTGLLNRTLLEDRITQAITLAKRNQSCFAVCFLDLDEFKEVNDAYGHGVGDLVLCAVTKSLRQCIRDVDTLARVGGDEFALLLLNINSAEDAITVAKKILRACRNKILINDKKFLITISIGIAIYRTGDTHQTLLKKADTAMYDVKNHGKNNFKVYNALDA